MTIRIGDNEYCLDGYMTEIQKLIFDAYHQGLVDGIGKGRADAIDEALKSYIHWIENEDRANVSFEEVLLRLKEQTNE